MGAGECSTDISSQAEEVGRLIAQQGAILICGGHRGVMEAAAKGAKAAGGLTVGILPESDDKSANPYIDVPIVTGMGDGRNVINILSSQAIIAISGGYGTLSEIALALKSRTPVVALCSWSLSSPLRSFSNEPLLYNVAGPEEAVSQAIELAKCSR